MLLRCLDLEGLWSGHKSVLLWQTMFRIWLQLQEEKTLEGPLDCKEIQSVHSEGDQSWVFIGRTDAKAETPILWPPHVKS